MMLNFWQQHMHICPRLNQLGKPTEVLSTLFTIKRILVGVLIEDAGDQPV